MMMLCAKIVAFIMKKYKDFRDITCSNWIFLVVIMLIAVIISKVVTGAVLLMLVDSVRDTFKILYLLYSCIIDMFVILLINTLFSKQELSCLGITSRVIEGYYKGMFCGTILSVLVIAVTYFGLSGQLEINKNINIIVTFMMLIGFLIQATSEEILFRGYIQNVVKKKNGNRFAIVIQASIFALVHLLSAEGQPIAVINLFLFSVLLGWIMAYFKNIFLVSGIHFIWNVFITFIINGKISGIVVKDYVTRFNFKVNSVFTGGKFGIEGSLFVTIIFIVMILIIKIKRGRM